MLYTDFWGHQTGTPSTRCEVIFGGMGQCTAVVEHGNCEIPVGGYACSLPKGKVKKDSRC
ncbi:MAG: hypothetical protein LBD15_04415 [Holosporales bacterium]|nr:hypothetical protein [Holosporales bacterium]